MSLFTYNQGRLLSEMSVGFQSPVFVTKSRSADMVMLLASNHTHSAAAVGPVGL